MSAISVERIQFMAAAFVARGLPLLIYVCTYHFMSSSSSSISNTFAHYRFQGNTKPPRSLVEKAAKQALFDQLIMQRPLLWFSYDLFTWIGAPSLTSSLPSLTTVLLHFVFFLFSCDTLTYWAHRLLHHPKLYATFHKQHHEFHANHPLASAYFHFVDDLLTGTIPTMFGPIILRSHVAVTFCWVALRICETAEAHFSFSNKYSVFQLGRPTDFHDFHHSHNMGNFGSFFTFWDKLCGTDAAYNDFNQKKKRES